MAKLDAETIKQNFDILDLNKDGLISFEEFAKYQEIDEKDEDQVQFFRIIFDLMDNDENGMIDLNEFGRFAVAQSGLDYTLGTKDYGILLFRLIDVDNSGFIEKKEIPHYMKAIGAIPTMKAVNDFIAQLDTDGDKRINLQEFMALLEE